jgi:predicted O-methyltransferase YrrM
MTPVFLSYQLMSEIIWKKIFDNSLQELYSKKESFFTNLNDLEKLRNDAEYNTGSISTSSAWSLFSISYYFKPKKVLEVGTFIGKSTYSIALGSDTALSDTAIHTCDFSNNIILDLKVRSSVNCYPKTSSTDMFKSLAAKGENGFDMIHLDGRLQGDDFSLLDSLLSEDAVVILDDFEGIEKGVANVFNLGAQKKLAKYIIIYPPNVEILQKYGFHESCNTAMLLPKKLLQLTAQ